MKSIPSHYNGIDETPVYVWAKIHETNDLSWLLVKRKKLNSKLIEALTKIWENIYDEYISEFGFSEQFLSIKQKELEIAKLQIKLILTKDGILQTWIEIAQEELKELEKAVGKANFMESKIAIENKFKFQINMKITSIREFYAYLKHLK